METLYNMFEDEKLLALGAANGNQRETFETEFSHLEFEEIFNLNNQLVTVECHSKTKWEVCAIHPDGGFTLMMYRSSDKDLVIKSAKAEITRRFN